MHRKAILSGSQLGPRKFRCITYFMHRYQMHFDVVYCTCSKLMGVAGIDHMKFSFTDAHHYNLYELPRSTNKETCRKCKGQTLGRLE